MSGFVIGVDGGGTKTAAAILPTRGETVVPIATGHAGPSNIAAVGAEAALTEILAAIAAMQGQIGEEVIDSIVVGIAGYSHEARREQVQAGMREKFSRTRIELLPDYSIAFEGALGGKAGILVIAGTGQIAYGRNAAGDEHRAGGYGYVIDDCGSGYGVGRQALAAALAAMDGAGAATILAELVWRELGTNSVPEIVSGVYGGAIDRARIASLSRLVSLAADEGDSVAINILKDAGRSLAAIAVGVSKRLFKMDDSIAISTAGGLWASNGVLRDSFQTKVRERIAHADFRDPLSEPVVGGALRARLIALNAEAVNNTP